MPSFESMTRALKASVFQGIHIGSAHAGQLLSSYLGSADEPVAFGGRASVLAELDGWLRDDARPYGLLVAGAGRGKSALLCRWAQSVAREGSHRVVFAPVSVRFQTASRTRFFPDLARALHAVHGLEHKASASKGSAYALRATIAQLLEHQSDGTPILLIIDGLDEASDWRVERDLPLPDRYRAKLSIMCAARPLAERDAAGWRAALGWSADLTRTAALPPLDRDGVRSVLTSMAATGAGDGHSGLVELAERGDVVRALCELTDGDPLLIQLYVEMLQTLAERGAPLSFLSGADLPRSPPGLAGFFARWWREQRRAWGPDAAAIERRARLVLEALAAALGPVRGSELAGLIAQELAPAPGSSTIRAELGRLVIGAGQTGYALAHPRLAEFFGRAQEPKIIDAKRIDWPLRYLTWGARELDEVRAGTRAPGDVSPYVLRHHGAHLERAGTGASGYHSLLTQAWSRAWEASEGRFDGFLVDVDRAWRAAEGCESYTHEAGVTALRCALIHASVAGMAWQLPAGLPALLVAEGIWSASFALAHCRTVQGDYKIDALAALAPLLGADEIVELWPKIAQLPLIGMSDDAGRVHAALMLRAVALNLATTAEVVAALSTCGPQVQLSAGPRLLPELDPGLRREVIALLLKNAGESRDTGKAALLRALRWAQAGRQRDGLVDALKSRSHDRVTLAWLAAGGEADRALQIALRDTLSYPRINSLAAAIPWLRGDARTYALDEWLAAYREQAESGRVGGVSVPCPLPEPWRTELLTLLDDLPAGVNVTMALCRLARCGGSDGQVRDLARARVDQLGDPVDQVFGLHMLLAGAPASAQPAMAERAVQLLRRAIAEQRFTSLSDRWQAWPDIGPVRLASWWYKPYVAPEHHLCALAPYLAPAARRSLLLAMLEITRHLDDGPWQSGAIGALLPHLADGVAAGSPLVPNALLEEAIARCHRHPLGAVGLVELLPHVEMRERGRLIAEAAAAIPAEDDQRASLLARLAMVAAPADRPGLRRQAIDALFSARHLHDTESVIGQWREQFDASDYEFVIEHVWARAATDDNPGHYRGRGLAERILLALADGRVSRTIADDIIERNRERPLWTMGSQDVAGAVPHASVDALEIAIDMSFNPDPGKEGPGLNHPHSKSMLGRVQIQRACVVALAGAGQIERAERLARQIARVTERGVALAEISAHLTRAGRAHALRDIMALVASDDSLDDAPRHILSAAATHLARYDWAGEILEAVTVYVPRDLRISSLIELLPHLPAPGREALAREILELLTEREQYIGHMLHGLQPYLAELAALSADELWPHFCRWLRDGANVSRARLLGGHSYAHRRGVRELAPMLGHFGLASVACEQILAIGDWFE